MQHVEALFSWLDYCDQIVSSSQPALGRALCESFHEVFLSASLLPKLLKAYVVVVTVAAVTSHYFSVRKKKF